MAITPSNDTHDDFPAFTLWALVFGLGAPLAVYFLALTAGEDIGFGYGVIAYWVIGDIVAKIIGIPLSIAALKAKEKLPVLAVLALLLNVIPGMVIMHLFQ